MKNYSKCKNCKNYGCWYMGWKKFENKIEDNNPFPRGCKKFMKIWINP